MNGRVLGGLCAIAALGLDQGTKALALTTPALESGVANPIPVSTS